MNRERFEFGDEEGMSFMEASRVRMDAREGQGSEDEPELPAGYRHVRSAIDALLMSLL